MLFLCLQFPLDGQLNSLNLNSTTLDLGKFKLLNCCVGTCAVLIEQSEEVQERSMPPDAIWDEPIRIHFFIDSKIVVELEDILASIEEDSQIALNEGLYIGEGAAYIYAGQTSIDLSELNDLGFPLRADVVQAAVSSINDMNVGLGAIYDAELLEARSCFGMQKFSAIIRDNLEGIQEVSSLNIAPNNAFSFPGATFKMGAHNELNFRNHAISHHAGQNSSDHEFGDDSTKRPMLTEEGKSYGWSTTGLIGYSGGTAIGVGPEGENIAGYIRATYADWLTIVPNLKIEDLSYPSSIKETEMANFSAFANKDIGNENWFWEFTNGVDELTSEEAAPSILFPSPGQWTFTVTLSNDCGGQVIVEQGAIEVTMTGTKTTDVLATGIRIFPRPFNHQLIIESKDLSLAEIEIYDSSGKRVFKNDGGLLIDTSHLISGVYHLRLVDIDGKEYVEKIVKL